MGTTYWSAFGALAFNENTFARDASKDFSFDISNSRGVKEAYLLLDFSLTGGSPAFAIVRFSARGYHHMKRIKNDENWAIRTVSNQTKFERYDRPFRNTLESVDLSYTPDAFDERTDVPAHYGTQGMAVLESGDDSIVATRGMLVKLLDESISSKTVIMTQNDVPTFSPATKLYTFLIRNLDTRGLNVTGINSLEFTIFGSRFRSRDLDIVGTNQYSGTFDLIEE